MQSANGLRFRLNSPGHAESRRSNVELLGHKVHAPGLEPGTAVLTPQPSTIELGVLGGRSGILTRISEESLR